MLNSPLLEITLGLVFIFTLFSLLVSAANEIIVALLKSRAVSLWDGIGMLLQGNGQLRQNFFDHPLIRSVTPPQSWGARITSDRRKAPSYIEARTFAVALLDLLKQPHAILSVVEAELKRTVAELRTGNTSGLGRATTTLGEIAAQLPATPLGVRVKQHLQGLQERLGDTTQSAAQLARLVDDALQVLPAHWMAALKESASQFSPGLEGTLKALAEDAAGSIESFRQGIERWFDEGMARVSGWYKRWTQAVQFGLGLVLAIAFNVDSVNIVRVLEGNEQLRRTLAARAEAYAKTAALDARNVIGQQSSGPFTISLQSPDAQTFELKAGLPSDLPSGVKFETLKVTATPSEELAPLEVRCERARQEPKNQEPRVAVIPCTINQRVLARKSGVIQVTYAWAQQKNNQSVTETRSASIPVVLVPDAEKQFEDIQTRLKETGLPLGWRNFGEVQVYLVEHHIFAAIGWLLTALAASLGAPFWFDLLKKVANLRSAGPNPNEKKSTPAAA